MEFQVFGITGRAVARIGDKYRLLACDMRAGESLYGAVGEFWPYWLAERCVGSTQGLAGYTVRFTDELPKEELGILLVALLASDRAKRPCVDTVESVLQSIGDDDLLEAQKLATEVVQSCFAIPGKGLVKEKRQRRRRKKEPWDWKRIVETAFGPMGLSREEFWGMTLIEWRTSMSGYVERERISMRKLAWISRNQLISAGAKPEDVSIEILLCEKTAKRHSRGPFLAEEEKKEKAKRVWAKIQAQRLAREQMAAAEPVSLEPTEPNSTRDSEAG
jgi:hypothetical protein